ncbi:hypothetical protein GCM10011328_00310 [Hafnia psychrotolerans]|uniref:Uncharacterized protein n=1 Tax=Hafnia psychrotolerans TaxID=1477018 RepID=A0ABQ1FWC1_9GAMM|nr:hypothetical protein GCM10011328_00310 [Hafnia psychrotolerans]
MGEDAEWLENCCCTRQPDGLTEPLAVQLWKAEETFLSISSFKFKFKFNIKVVGAGPHRVKGRKRGP